MNTVVIRQDPLMSNTEFLKNEEFTYSMYTLNKEILKDGMLSFEVKQSIIPVCSNFLGCFRRRVQL